MENDLVWSRHVMKQDEFECERKETFNDGREEGGRKNAMEDRKKRYGRVEHMDRRKEEPAGGRTTLVIEGNAVYELDEECLRNKNRD